jgi:hypothetical protein
MRLYDKYIELLSKVNDEDKTREEHQEALAVLHGWKLGVFDCSDGKYSFNGNYHYTNLGINRPMCAGVFLDWKSKVE